MVVWIHKEVGELDRMDRAKIGLEFYVKNLKARKFSKKEKEELVSFFSREMLEDRLEYNQTS